MKANMVCVLGGTGSGKTTRVLRVHLKPKPKRLAIIDFKRDPLLQGYADVVNARELVNAVTRPAFCVRYQPSFDPKARETEFEWFCRLVHHVGNMAVFVPELARYVRPGWAPAGWTMITTTGREYSVAGKVKHLDVYADSQRSAGIDKDFLSNCTVIECGVLEAPRDIATMAEVLRCPPQTVQTLKPGQFVRRERGATNFTIVGKPF